MKASAGISMRLAILILISTSVVFMSPVLIDPSSRIAGGNGDPLLVAYIVTWVAEHLGTANLWNPPFFHPASNVLAWSDHLLGLGVFAWPAVAAGVSPILLINTITWLAFAGTSVAIFFWLLDDRHATKPALAAAVTVTYGAWRVQQLSHPQLLFMPFLPAALVCYRRAIAPNASAWWIWAGAGFLTIQTYCTPSLSIYMLPLVAVWVSTAFVTSGNRDVRRLPGLAASLAAVVLFNYPVAVHYWAEGASLDRTPVEIARFSVHWIDWVSAPARHWLYGERLAFTRGLERELFPGFGFTGILTFGILAASSSPRRDHRALWPATVAGAVALWASTGPSPGAVITVQHLPYDVLQAFAPGGGQVRVPARFVLLAGIFLAPAIALGWRAVFAQLRQHFADAARTRALGAALVLVVAVEAIPGLAYVERVDDFDDEIPHHQISRGVLFVPVSATPREEIRRMWAARRLGVPVVNGYSGKESVLWRTLAHLERIEIDDMVRRATYSRLLDAGVDTIVVDAPSPLLDPVWLDWSGNRVFRILPTVAVPSTHHLAAGSGAGLLITGEGWSYPEQDETESWVWSVNRRATLRVPMDGTQRGRLAMRVRTLHATNAAHLEVRLKGAVLGSAPLRTSPAWITFALPEDATREGWTAFELHGPEPTRVTGSADPRRLSVCLYEVRWD